MAPVGSDLHVVYVCADPGVPVFGRKGSSVHVQEVIRALHRRGDRVTLLCARTGGPPPADLAVLDVRELPRVRAEDTAERERGLMRADLVLADVLADLGPADLIYERYSLWSTAAMRHAATNDIPSVLEVNSPLVQEQAQHRGLVHHADAEHAARRVLTDAGRVVAVSEPVAAWVRSVVDRDGVLVVPNGVDTERIRPATAAGPTDAALPTDRPLTVGFLGTLKPWHGVDVLLRALASARADLRVLLVGDGPEAGPLAALAADLGVAGRVEAVGAVDPLDVPGFLHRMDVAVAPYPDSPGMYFSPLKLYEYMAAGLPIVASDIGQVRAALTDGVDVVLVAPGGVTALAEALDDLAADPIQRRCLGTAARATAVAHHSWDDAVGRILAAAVRHRVGATP